MKYRRVIIAVTVTCLCVPFAFGQDWPKEPIPARRIRDEIKAHESGLAVWWTGHNGWLIKSDNLLIGTDLATEDEGRLYQSPITAAELAPLLDIAFITHKHGDHFNRKTAHILGERGKCVFVMPANCVGDARGLGIPETRIQVATRASRSSSRARKSPHYARSMATASPRSISTRILRIAAI